MPISKHRRKPGGKHVRRPGRRVSTYHLDPEATAFMDAHKKFNDLYKTPHSDLLEDRQDAWFMADIIQDKVWKYNKPPTPTSKEAVFAEFTNPVSGGEKYSMQDAESALAYLVQHGLAEVSGDAITIPARFFPE